MLGVLRMNIKAGSTQKHITFFSGNVEMLGNLRTDIKGGEHKSSEFFEKITYYDEMSRWSELGFVSLL